MIANHITPILQQLESEGYGYCILGGELLPEKLPGSDIDILVSRIDKKLELIFESLGFIKSKGKQVFLGKPVVYCLYDYEDGWIPIHLTTPQWIGHKRISPDNYSFYVEERRGLKFATGELYFCVTVMQSFYKKNITEKRASRLNELWIDPKIDQARCLRVLRDVGDDGAAIAKEIEQQASLDIGVILTKNSIRKKVGIYRKTLLYLSQKIHKKEKKRYGVLVSVEGVDGSGKSSFVDLLNRSIPKEGRELFIQKSMAGRGFGKYSRKLRSIWRRSCDKQSIFNSIFKNVLLPIVFFVEMVNLYLIYARSKRRKVNGMNVMFDRYACLHYVRQKVNNKNQFLGKKTYIDLLFRYSIKLFPPPDIFVYFDIDPLVAYERKKEDRLEDIKEKRFVYENDVLPCYDKLTEVFIIDAKLPQEDIVRSFLSKYWKTLV